MANNYFQFKQFKIIQDKAAMKVGTDGVLLGAWVNVNKATKVLDIGTGTGLLALMVAQRCNAHITAIEIDAAASKEANFNFKNSQWSKRMTSIHVSLQHFAAEAADKFDCIVCNPPYFNNSFKANHETRTIARHTDYLSYNVLLEAVARLLRVGGTFSVVLPAEAKLQFEKIASDVGLFVSKLVWVKTKPSKPAKRVMFEFKFENVGLKESELVIHEESSRDYATESRNLTKDFYLNF